MMTVGICKSTESAGKLSSFSLNQTSFLSPQRENSMTLLTDPAGGGRVKLLELRRFSPVLSLKMLLHKTVSVSGLLRAG